jgi:hypothetical protein
MIAEEKIGERSQLVVVTGEMARSMKLIREPTEKPGCGAGKHCTVHGYARAPIFQCCICGEQFEIDE